MSSEAITDLTSSIEKAQEAFTNVMNGVLQRQESIQKRKADIDKRFNIENQPLSQLIKMNIGGDTKFVVRRDTLTRLPSRLAQMFSGRWEKDLPKDAEGRTFLDLDPRQMRAIFTWLADLKKIGADDSKLPHPQETLSSEYRWGFAELLQYLQLAEHVPQTKVKGLAGSAILESSDRFEWLKSNLMQTGSDPSRRMTLELLFRASVDGFSAQSFHQKCDGKGATVTVACSVGGFVFGGYSDVPWASTSSYKACTGSFLFRLEGPGVASPSRHDLFQNHQHGIYCHSNYGPTWGGGHDLNIGQGNQAANVTSSLGSTYNKSGGGVSLNTLAERQDVSITEYEVYQVCIEPERKGLFDRLQEELESSEHKDLLAACCSVSSAVTECQKELQAMEADLVWTEQSLEDEAVFMKRYLSSFKQENADPLVCLNVSGVPFTIARSTLAQERDSMIASKFGPSWTLQEEELVDGSVFIEEDPESFAFVMQYLRMLQMGSPPKSWPQLTASRCSSLRRVVDYWGLKKLAELPELPVDSVLLNADMNKLSVLLGWLPRSESSSELKLELLFRASRDGFTSQSFHQKCDSKGATLTVARSGGNFIFGGFSDTAWDSGNSYRLCSTSFLFRLSGPGVSTPSRHDLYQNQSCGIYCSAENGPTWGGGHDLHIPNSSGNTTTAYCNLGHTYRAHETSTLSEGASMTITEYEVFKVG